MGFINAIRAFLDPSSVAPERESPFAQYRYPYLVVRIPPGKRAPKHCVISAAGGVEEFQKIFPYASAEDIGAVQCAFEFEGVRALRIIPAW